jgi:hypothetical protein
MEHAGLVVRKTADHFLSLYDLPSDEDTLDLPFLATRTETDSPKLA